MAVAFNESSVWAEVLTPGVQRQRLLTAARVPATRILLDRVKLAAAASIALEIAAGELAWLQMLEGEALLSHGQAKVALGATHVVFLTSGFNGTLTTRGGAAFLYAQVPGASRLDANLAAQPPQFRVIDWTRQPVICCAEDACKRIAIATPQLAGTTAVRGEMIIYPPQDATPALHRDGPGHFMYVLSGHGSARAGAKAVELCAGDVVHFAEREARQVSGAGGQDLVCVEFFAPGVYNTLRAESAPA